MKTCKLTHVSPNIPECKKTFLCAKPALNIHLTIAHSNFFRMSHCLVLAHSQERDRQSSKNCKCVTLHRDKNHQRQCNDEDHAPDHKNVRLIRNIEYTFSMAGGEDKQNISFQNPSWMYFNTKL